MSLSAETLSALQQLMAQNKELLAQVQTTTNAVQAAALIARAADNKGITVSQSELTMYLEEVSRTVMSQPLSDQQLDTVAGGFGPSPLVGTDDERMATLSIMSFGIGCATVSIGQATGDMMGFTKRYCR